MARRARSRVAKTERSAQPAPKVPWLERLFGARVAAVAALPVVEEYEPRLLYSADTAPHALALSPNVVEQRFIDADGEYFATSEETDAGRVELLIVDGAVSGFESLLESLGTEGRRIEVLVLDPNTDGIAQISAALSEREDLAALHIVSHGASGEVKLGSTLLDSAALSSRSAEISRWSDALNSSADILIYGCDVASDASGIDFVQGLSLLTLADVAASSDLTGGAALGADWNLEFASGAVESGLAFNAEAIQDWNGVLANATPVLSGANDLAPVAEDPATNPGTPVSDLVAGQVTDADAGALRGIAVVAVDDTNGTWQYSTDGGASWTDFGAVSLASGRLLAADASTYVRFVPDANFNGTVTDGLTFRAWDQTSGTAGTTADTTALTTDTVRDNFATVSYSNNNGTENWSTGWIDVDGNPGGGNIFISGGQLVLSANLINFDTIAREVDLSSATSARLSFSYNNQLALLSAIDLQVSSNGGASYTTLATFSPTSNTGAGTFSTDISAFIAANTRIRFAITGVLLGNTLAVDNLEISYTTSAFSAASASSDITVTAVNDAPLNTVPGAQSVAEDATLVFSSGNGNPISIADVDAASSPVQVTLSVTNGTLTLAGTGGLTFSTGDGTSDSSMVFTGTLADVNAALNGLAYTPTADFNGAALLTLTTNDQGNTGSGGARNDSDSVSIDVTALNDAPANTVPGVQGTDQDTVLVFSSANGNAIAISDADAGSNALQVTLTATNGTVTLSGIAGLTFTTGDGTAETGMVFTGTLTDINAALNGLQFAPAGGFTGTASLQIDTSDQGNTGAGGAQTDSDTISILVNNVNDAPVNTVPGAQSTNEDTMLVFSTTNGNRISVADPDAGSNAIEVTINATNGTLTLGSVTGLTFTDGDGTADASMTFTGTLANINAALNGLAYTPTGNYSGPAALRILTDDQGNTGSGGAQSDTDTINITVVPVADTPSATNAATLEDTQTTTGLVITPNPVDGTEVTHFKITGITGGTLYLDDGTTAIAEGSFITVADGAAGLKFTPSPDSIADGSFRVRASVGGTDAGLGGSLVTATIDVTAVNDAPTLALAGNQTVDEDSAPQIVPGFATATAGGGTDESGQTFAYTVTNDNNALFLVQPAIDTTGRLTYTLAPNASGIANLTVSVTDNGGTANGGSDTSASQNFTITVSAVNDAPLASPDANTLTEDAAGVSGNVLTNDTDIEGATLTVTQVNGAPGNVGTALNGAYGALTLQSDGRYAYVLNNALGAVQSLRPGDTLTDSFTYQVGDSGGATDTGTLMITISGVNDVAVIGGSASGGAAEDSAAPNLSVAGALAISDADAGESSFIAQAGTAGIYGAFSVDSAGNWTYTAANAQAAIQQLAAGTSLSETFNVVSADGSANRDVVITIDGANDTPVISGSASGSVSEDASSPNLSTAGSLAISDGDAGESAFVAQPGIAGTYGTFAVDAAGSWTYTAANAQASIQQLAAGATISESFNVTSLDGTASQTIVVTLTGVNDAPHASSNAVSLSGTTSHVLQQADFGYADAEGENLATVRITAAPSTGVLLLDGIPVAPGQDISAADLAAGKLSFALSTAPADTVSDAFTFRVSDGTAYSGSSYTFTINVIPNIAAESGTPAPDPVTTTQPSPPPVNDTPAAPVNSPLATSPASAGGKAPSQQPNGSPQAGASLGNLDNAITESSALQPAASQSGVPSAAAEVRGVENVSSRNASARHTGFLLRTATFEPARFGISLPVPASLQSPIAEVRALPAATQNASFLQELDRLRETMQSEVEFEHRIIGSAVAVGTGLSVGYVIWLLRGGLLITSLLSSLPAWRYIDPLPVLGRLQGDEEEDGESLESLVSARSREEDMHG